jgi:hypothetical protein
MFGRRPNTITNPLKRRCGTCARPRASIKTEMASHSFIVNNSDLSDDFNDYDESA